MLKKLKWILLTIAVLYSFIGFFILPWIIKSQLPKIVEETTKGHLELEDVTYNPWIGRLDLVGVHFSTPEQQRFIDLGRLTVNANPLWLAAGRIEVKMIRLDDPRISVIHQADGSFNFDWLTKLGGTQEKSGTADESTESALPHIILEKFSIRDGRVAYLDLTKSEPFDIQLGPLYLYVDGIDTANVQNSKDKISFFTSINDGSSLSIKTELLSLEPVALTGHVAYESGALYTGWRYMQEQLALEVAEGRLSADFDFNLDLADIEAIRIDNIHAALQKLRIKPKSRIGDVLSVGQITLDGGVVEPLKRRVALEDFNIHDVAIAATRESDGTIDWERFAQLSGKNKEISEEGAEPERNESDAHPWHVTLEHFGMDGIGATFRDEAVTPNVTSRLDNLKLDIDDITSRPATPIDYNLSLAFNGAMTCQGRGKVEHTPLNVSSSLGCQAIDLTWFNPYIDQAARGALEHYDAALVNAKAGFELQLSVTDHNGTVGVNIDDSSLILDAIKVRQPSSGTTLLDLKQIRVEGVSANTATQQAAVQKLLLNRPSVHLERMKNGTINLSKVAVPKHAAPAKAGKKGESGKAEKPWEANLNHFIIDTGKVTFKDAAVEGGARFVVDRIGVKVNDISSKRESTLKYRTTMRINQSGRLRADGTLKHTPLWQKGTVELKNFQLADLNPYIEEQLFAKIRSGALSIKSDEIYSPSNSKSDLSVKGSLTLNDLAVNNTLDDSLLVSLKKVDVKPYLFEYAPDTLFIEEIEITGLYANAIVDQNKTFNFSQLKKGEQKSADSKETEEVPEVQRGEATKPFPVKIVKVSVTESSADFADFALPLDFQTHIHDLNGLVYAISSIPTETSYIDLDGVVDKYGSAKIKGSVNSADPKQFTDMAVAFRNLGLNQYSPYSANFAGRKIDEGKLFLDLEYKINESQMQGENSVIIKKIKLGDEVESENALSLPLGLAIALLEDSEGVIDIDMPVEGDLNNPDFKYGATIWKTVGNLITNVVTAPFRFLGSLLGIEGAELEYIEFEPGSTALLPPELEKLDTLSKAFKKRPRLSLGVSGRYDTAADKYAMQRAKLIEMALSRVKQESKEGEVPELTVSLLETLYEEMEGEAALEKLLKEYKTRYDKRDERKEAYAKELPERLIALQMVSTEELSSLAARRASAISTYLTLNKGIASERIRVKEVGANEDEAQTWVKTKLGIEVNE
ncbi:MAG: DUF748 domain-containing protein [Campylobacterota bacterium]|nr:DUF748 domain-containing protein [Campylobacterota bacterium]